MCQRSLAHQEPARIDPGELISHAHALVFIEYVTGLLPFSAIMWKPVAMLYMGRDKGYTDVASTTRNQLHQRGRSGHLVRFGCATQLNETPSNGHLPWSKGMFSIWTRPLSIALLGLAAASANAATPGRLTVQETNDLRQLIDSAPPHGTPALMDLSNPAHERAYYALLRLNGMTPERRPNLYRTLAKVKQTHVGLRADGAPLPALSLQSSAFAGTDAPRNDYAVLNIGTSDWKKIDSTAFSTMFNGSHYSNTMVTVTDSSGDVIKSNAAEEWDGGRDMAVDSGEGENKTGGLIDAVGIYYGEDKSGAPYGPVYAAISGGYFPKQVNNDRPTITTTNTNIVVCLNRANADPTAPTACDYGPTDPGRMPPDIKFPFKGSVQYHDPIDIDPATGKPPKGLYSVTLSLTGRSTGGNCKMVDIAEKFMNDPNTKIKGDTITWDLEPANFSTVCWQNNEFYTLTLALMLGVKSVPVWATITNAPNAKPTISTLITKQLQLQYGCMLEGTPILMADGSTKPVEKVDKGDRLRGRDGTDVIVEWRTTGWDTHSVELTDKAGGRVELTPLHPVATQRGMVQARDLKKGDVVYGPRGRTTLATVTPREAPKAFNVFNLGVVSGTGTAITQRDDAAFFAGALLVGDAAVQGELAARQALGSGRSPAQLRARVPNAWRADFDNWTREQSARGTP